MSVSCVQPPAPKVRTMQMTPVPATAHRTLRGVPLLAVLALTAIGSAGRADDVVYLDQHWTPQLREQFYFTPQGSRLIPYDWFMALERPDDTELLSSPASLSRFGWLYQADSSTTLNPGRLPIGFTLEPAEAPGGGHWMG